MFLSVLDLVPFKYYAANMSNSIGKILKVTTFGESHGKCVGVVIDGCPAGICITADEINEALSKRRPGTGVASSGRKETDKAEILSGLYNGKTTGAPISVIIGNTGHDSADYAEIAGYFRPGHADYTYCHKYNGFNDPMGGGRASGRETAARVAAGAVAKKITEGLNIDLFAHTIRIGNIKAESFDCAQIEANALKCGDSAAAVKMGRLIEEARASGDSVGGVVELRIKNVPVGLGEPVFDKLDARLAYALMGIPAVKGVEVGDGFQAAASKGSENNDQMRDGKFLSNHAGGLLGGISTGEEIIVRCAIKPVPSISMPQSTVDKNGNNITVSIKGRHDVCIVPRAVPVVEAMAWITLADFVLLARAFKSQGC